MVKRWVDGVSLRRGGRDGREWFAVVDPGDATGSREMTIGGTSAEL